MAGAPLIKVDDLCPIHRGFIAMSGVSRNIAVHSDSISTTPRTPVVKWLKLLHRYCSGDPGGCPIHARSLRMSGVWVCPFARKFHVQCDSISTKPRSPVAQWRKLDQG